MESLFNTDRLVHTFLLRRVCSLTDGANPAEAESVAHLMLTNCLRSTFSSQDKNRPLAVSLGSGVTSCCRHASVGGVVHRVRHMHVPRSLPVALCRSTFPAQASAMWTDLLRGNCTRKFPPLSDRVTASDNERISHSHCASTYCSAVGNQRVAVCVCVCIMVNI